MILFVTCLICLLNIVDNLLKVLIGLIVQSTKPCTLFQKVKIWWQSNFRWLVIYLVSSYMSINGDISIKANKCVKHERDDLKLTWQQDLQKLHGLLLLCFFNNSQMFTYTRSCKSTCQVLSWIHGMHLTSSFNFPSYNISL